MKASGWAVLAVLAVGAGLAALLFTVRARPEPGRAARELPPEARAAAERFFDTYGERDGRIVRKQGDTVSQEQAYAMLLAAALGDESRFDAAWRWTRENLGRPDGLLASRWQDGRVVEAEPAAEADVEAAHALLVAAERFGREDLEDEARRLGDAILRLETAVLGSDELILLPGPRARRAPYVVNPGDASPVAFAALEDATGEQRWAALRQASYRMLAELTPSEPELPPDWAVVDVSGAARPSSPPGRPGVPPSYGLPAARGLLRMSTTCDEEGRELAARAWRFLDRQSAGQIASVYDLKGAPLVRQPHPLGLAAAAGVARSAGYGGRASELLDRAEELERRTPSSYGAAWVALARAMTESEALGTCAGGG